MKKKLVCFLSVVLTVWLLLPLGAFAASFQIDFDTACDALQLVNLDTGTVVYEKNADKRREPASTTKIMTYIVVYENVEDPDNTTVTISEKIRDELLGTGSSLSGIEVGDVLTVKQLLCCMMIPSGNDAALALADFVGGGDVQKFVDMMNEKAAELGCTNTHFMNPHGLHDDEHYTTARDLAIITQYAMMLPDFMDITNTTNIYYKPYGGPDAEEKRLLVTTNRLIHKNLDPQYYYQYAQGIKTGSHDQAGYCLVSTATKNGMSYLCVALGAPSVDESGNRISEHGECTDSINLYEWAFGNLGFRTLADTEDAVTEIELRFAWNKDTLLLVPQESFTTILPDDISSSSILATPNIPDYIEAPVKKGDVIGTVTYSYADQTLATINLVAGESVERSELLKSASTVKDIVTSTWFLAIVGVILFLVVIYIILALIYNRKKKKLRKVRKYKNM